MKPAVFLDRDGTIIEQVHYLSDPDDVRLIPGAGQAIRMLRAAGYACVLITNQSAIGRGLLTAQGFEQVQRELCRQLKEHGGELDATYFCSLVPQAGDRSIVEHPDRKPGPGLLRRAARELGLDLARSWMVGDMLSDARAGRNAGCRGTILAETGYGATVAQSSDGAVDHVVADLLQAARMIIRLDAVAECRARTV